MPGESAKTAGERRRRAAGARDVQIALAMLMLRALLLLLPPPPLLLPVCVSLLIQNTFRFHPLLDRPAFYWATAAAPLSTPSSAP